jgi:hypothetical protein
VALLGWEWLAMVIEAFVWWCQAWWLADVNESPSLMTGSSDVHGIALGSAVRLLSPE